MKKVRALAAVGTAAPVAIGMTMMPATAHAAVTPQWRNCTTTGLLDNSKAYSAHGSAVLGYQGHCAATQAFYLGKHQTGLTERVRFWSNGKIIRSTWQAGRVGTNATTFASSPNVVAQMVCMALVSNNNHNKVEYGPLCTYTSSL